MAQADWNLWTILWVLIFAALWLLFPLATIALMKTKGYQTGAVIVAALVVFVFPLLIIIVYFLPGRRMGG